MHTIGPFCSNSEQRCFPKVNHLGKESSLFCKKRKTRLEPQHSLRNDEAWHDGILSLYVPSNLTQLKCQLQAPHGNEAENVVLLYSNPSVGYKTLSCANTACKHNKTYASPWMERPNMHQLLTITFAIVLSKQ